MRIGQLRWLLWSAAAILLIGGAGMGTWAVITPVKSRALNTAPIRHPPTESVRQAADPPSAAAWQAVCAVPLRRPLYDSPAPVPTVMASLPPLRIRLAGTVIEPGHSQAMLSLPDGTIEFKSVGQRCGDAEILSIGEKNITVRYQGRTIDLKVEQAN